MPTENSYSGYKFIDSNGIFSVKANVVNVPAEYFIGGTAIHRSFLNYINILGQIDNLPKI